MAKKKKEEEEDAWLWMSRPFSPGSVSVPSARTTANQVLEWDTIKGGTRKGSISSLGPGLSAGEQATFWFQQQSLQGGAFPAYLYYGRAGLLDPKAPVEAYGYGGFLGFSGWKRGIVGGVVGGIIGFSVGGMALTVIDPQDKWEGGYDETADYQQFERDYGEMRAPWKTQYIPTH